MPVQPMTVRSMPHDDSTLSAPSTFPVRPVAIGLVVLGVATCVIALVATLPASLVVQLLKIAPGAPATGTVWSGETNLENGDRISWRSDPLGSLLSFNLQSTVSVTGELTQLDGRLSAGGGGVTISGIKGVADWSLVRTALPDLALDCDIGIRFQDTTVVIDSGALAISGNATSSAGTCRAGNSDQSFEAPAAQMVATTTNGASRIGVALASDPSASLFDISIGAEGQLRATVEPLALNLVPGANASGPIVYEMRAR